MRETFGFLTEVPSRPHSSKEMIVPNFSFSILGARFSVKYPLTELMILLAMRAESRTVPRTRHKRSSCREMKPRAQLSEKIAGGSSDRWLSNFRAWGGTV